MPGGGGGHSGHCTQLLVQHIVRHSVSSPSIENINLSYLRSRPENYFLSVQRIHPRLPLGQQEILLQLPGMQQYLPNKDQQDELLFLNLFHFHSDRVSS